MSDKDKRSFEAVLRKKEKELAADLQRRGRDGIEVQSLPDSIDAVQLACEQALVISNLDRDSRLLRQVRSALARIADGTYGTCLRCEEDINPRRLTAVPWAVLCLACQEIADREDDNDPFSTQEAA